MMPLIYVDSRECQTARKIIQGLQNYSDIKLETANLGQCVDYLIPSEPTILIQRKRASEMISHKSVFEDLIGMKAIENSKPYLLLEGTLSIIQKFTKYPEEPIIGTVQTILDNFDVKIIPSPNQYWTVKWLALIARRAVKPKEHKPLPLGLRVPRELPAHEKARKILESFPQISTTLSRRILERYGTLKKALDNIENWDKHIPQIGKKTVAHILEILNTPYPKF